MCDPERLCLMQLIFATFSAEDTIEEFKLKKPDKKLALLGAILIH